MTPYGRSNRFCPLPSNTAGGIVRTLHDLDNIRLTVDTPTTFTLTLCGRKISDVTHISFGRTGDNQDFIIFDQTEKRSQSIILDGMGGVRETHTNAFM